MNTGDFVLNYGLQSAGKMVSRQEPCGQTRYCGPEHRRRGPLPSEKPLPFCDNIITKAEKNAVKGRGNFLPEAPSAGENS